ncbi:hypothetical protein Q7A53_01470 [Halobacillus rhizosphaerae]|uniref:hypothetical protein n=1 Tax=Halobacillus rhizosphaerae TaxID=3064889 RepID=UPI00398A90EF
MQNLFDMIFSNVFVLLAIIAGVFSWFKRMRSKEDKPIPSGPAVPKQDKDPERELEPHTVFSEQSRDRVGEYYDKKKKQLQDADQKENGKQSTIFTYETPNKDLHRQEVKGRELEVYVAGNDHSSTSPIKVNKKWNKNRIAEGIIMAEILGPPRAYKPHRSQIRKR